MRYYTRLGPNSGVSMPFWFYLFFYLPAYVIIVMFQLAALAVAAALVIAWKVSQALWVGFRGAQSNWGSARTGLGHPGKSLDARAQEARVSKKLYGERKRDQVNG
jgi:hypothetical protein